MPPSDLRTRLARLHLAWLYLGVCAALTGLVAIVNADMFDGGFGSLLFGMLALFAAPFVVIGRIVTAATYWAPVWLRALLVIGVIIACTALFDRYLTRWLRGGAQGTATPPPA